MQERHTVREVSVIVADALAQVDVTLVAVAIAIEEGGTEDGDRAFTLDGEVDVLGGTREALAIPDKVAYIWVSI
jgi:hypothetical protein